ncbi:acyltransferase [Cytobacillus sp. Hm23]
MSQIINHQRKASEVNIIKSLAFLAVVFQSSLIFAVEQGNISPEETVMIGMLFNFVKFSAPVFIFVTGFHLIYHHKQQVKYASYITQKWSELIVPYLFWSAIYVIFFTNFISTSTLTLSEMIKLIFTGAAAPHLWYVVMVFQFHLVFPLLFVIFQWLDKKFSSVKLIAFTVGCFAVSYLLLMWLSSRFIFNGNLLTDVAWLKYTDRSLLFYSFYFFLGGLVALKLTAWRKFVSKYVALNTFIFLGLFIVVGYELVAFNGVTQIDLQASTYLKPSMFLYVVSEIILLYGLSMIIVQTRTFLYKLLAFIGKFTYGSYLAHLFFLQLVVIFIENNHITGHYISLSIAIFIITTVLSIGFSFIFSHLPFATSIIGPFEKANWSLPALIGQLLPKEKPVYSKSLKGRD